VEQDEHRLPDGFKRIGYDADTGRYYFSDADGNYWEGPQGAEFGEMKRGMLESSVASPVLMLTAGSVRKPNTDRDRH
jgi:hypothetical protein